MPSAPSRSPACENRRRSRHQSSHHSSSSESRHSRGTPMLSRSSSEVSRSGDSSGRSSRASDIVMNLFSIRSRRDRSSSGPRPQSAFTDDVFVRSSVPSYARDNTAYGSMPSNKGKDIIATAPMASAAPYALSNIPAQTYFLQPAHQQASLQSQHHQRGRNYADENSHGNLGYIGPTTLPLSSPPMPYQAQYTSPYYPYISSNMRPWRQQVDLPGQTMPYPLPAPDAFPPQTQPSHAPSVDRGHHSTARSVPPRPSPRPNVREDTSPTPRSRRHRTVEHPPEARDRPQHRRHSRDDNHQDKHRSNAAGKSRRHTPSPVVFHRYSDLSRKLRLHICYGCGRVRSECFQKANPFHREKKPLLNFCGKCRGSGGPIPAE